MRLSSYVTYECVCSGVDVYHVRIFFIRGCRIKLLIASYIFTSHFEQIDVAKCFIWIEIATEAIAPFEFDMKYSISRKNLKNEINDIFVYTSYMSCEYIRVRICIRLYHTFQRSIFIITLTCKYWCFIVLNVR